MGCGCGGGAAPARRPVRNLVKSPTEGVLRAVTTNHGTTSVPNVENQAQTEERRKVEKLRRDAILRALGRP